MSRKRLASIVGLLMTLILVTPAAANPLLCGPLPYWASC